MAGQNSDGRPQFHLRRISHRTLSTAANTICFRGRITFIGRGDNVHYLVSSAAWQQRIFLSRRHCRLVRSEADNSHRLIDSSMTGVYVNDVKIAESCELGEGDVVTFGHPKGDTITAGTRVRQPDSEHQFVFEACSCIAESPQQDLTKGEIEKIREQHVGTAPTTPEMLGGFRVPKAIPKRKTQSYNFRTSTCPTKTVVSPSLNSHTTPPSSRRRPQTRSQSLEATIVESKMSARPSRSQKDNGLQPNESSSGSDTDSGFIGGKHKRQTKRKPLEQVGLRVMSVQESSRQDATRGIPVKSSTAIKSRKRKDPLNNVDQSQALKGESSSDTGEEHAEEFPLDLTVKCDQTLLSEETGNGAEVDKQEDSQHGVEMKVQIHEEKSELITKTGETDISKQLAEQPDKCAQEHSEVNVPVENQKEGLQTVQFDDDVDVGKVREEVSKQSDQDETDMEDGDMAKELDSTTEIVAGDDVGEAECIKVPKVPQASSESLVQDQSEAIVPSADVSHLDEAVLSDKTEVKTSDMQASPAVDSPLPTTAVEEPVVSESEVDNWVPVLCNSIQFRKARLPTEAVQSVNPRDAAVKDAVADVGLDTQKQVGESADKDPSSKQEPVEDQQEDVVAAALVVESVLDKVEEGTVYDKISVVRQSEMVDSIPGEKDNKMTEVTRAAEEDKQNFSHVTAHSNCEEEKQQAVTGCTSQIEATDSVICESKQEMDEILEDQTTPNGTYEEEPKSGCIDSEVSVAIATEVEDYNLEEKEANDIITYERGNKASGKLTDIPDVNSIVMSPTIVTPMTAQAQESMASLDITLPVTDKTDPSLGENNADGGQTSINKTVVEGSVESPNAVSSLDKTVSPESCNQPWQDTKQHEQLQDLAPNKTSDSDETEKEKDSAKTIAMTAIESEDDALSSVDKRDANPSFAEVTTSWDKENEGHVQSPEKSDSLCCNSAMDDTAMLIAEDMPVKDGMDGNKETTEKQLVLPYTSKGETIPPSYEEEESDRSDDEDTNISPPGLSQLSYDESTPNTPLDDRNASVEKKYGDLEESPEILPVSKVNSVYQDLSLQSVISDVPDREDKREEMIPSSQDSESDSEESSDRHTAMQKLSLSDRSGENSSQNVTDVGNEEIETPLSQNSTDSNFGLSGIAPLAQVSFMASPTFSQENSREAFDRVIADIQANEGVTALPSGLGSQDELPGIPGDVKYSTSVRKHVTWEVADSALDTDPKVDDGHDSDVDRDGFEDGSRFLVSDSIDYRAEDDNSWSSSSDEEELEKPVGLGLHLSDSEDEAEGRRQRSQSASQQKKEHSYGGLKASQSKETYHLDEQNDEESEGNDKSTDPLLSGEVAGMNNDDPRISPSDATLRSTHDESAPEREDNGNCDQEEGNDEEKKKNEKPQPTDPLLSSEDADIDDQNPSLSLLGPTINAPQLCNESTPGDESKGNHSSEEGNEENKETTEPEPCGPFLSSDIAGIDNVTPCILLPNPTLELLHNEITPGDERKGARHPEEEDDEENKKKKKPQPSDLLLSSEVAGIDDEDPNISTPGLSIEQSHDESAPGDQNKGTHQPEEAEEESKEDEKPQPSDVAGTYNEDPNVSSPGPTLQHSHDESVPGDQGTDHPDEAEEENEENLKPQPTDALLSNVLGTNKEDSSISSPDPTLQQSHDESVPGDQNKGTDHPEEAEEENKEKIKPHPTDAMLSSDDAGIDDEDSSLEPLMMTPESSQKVESTCIQEHRDQDRETNSAEDTTDTGNSQPEDIDPPHKERGLKRPRYAESDDEVASEEGSCADSNLLAEEDSNVTNNQPGTKRPYESDEMDKVLPQNKRVHLDILHEETDKVDAEELPVMDATSESEGDEGTPRNVPSFTEDDFHVECKDTENVQTVHLELKSIPAFVVKCRADCVRDVVMDFFNHCFFVGKLSSKLKKIAEDARRKRVAETVKTFFASQAWLEQSASRPGEVSMEPTMLIEIDSSSTSSAKKEEVLLDKGSPCTEVDKRKQVEQTVYEFFQRNFTSNKKSDSESETDKPVSVEERQMPPNKRQTSEALLPENAPEAKRQKLHESPHQSDSVSSDCKKTSGEVVKSQEDDSLMENKGCETSGDAYKDCMEMMDCSEIISNQDEQKTKLDQGEEEENNEESCHVNKDSTFPVNNGLSHCKNSDNAQNALEIDGLIAMNVAVEKDASDEVESFTEMVVTAADMQVDQQDDSKEIVDPQESMHTELFLPVHGDPKTSDDTTDISDDSKNSCIASVSDASIADEACKGNEKSLLMVEGNAEDLKECLKEGLAEATENKNPLQDISETPYSESCEEEINDADLPSEMKSGQSENQTEGPIFLASKTDNEVLLSDSSVFDETIQEDPCESMTLDNSTSHPNNKEEPEESTVPEVCNDYDEEDSETDVNTDSSLPSSEGQDTKLKDSDSKTYSPLPSSEDAAERKESDSDNFSLASLEDTAEMRDPDSECIFPVPTMVEADEVDDSDGDSSCCEDDRFLVSDSIDYRAEYHSDDDEDSKDDDYDRDNSDNRSDDDNSSEEEKNSTDEDDSDGYTSTPEPLLCSSAETNISVKEHNDTKQDEHIELSKAEASDKVGDTDRNASKETKVLCSEETSSTSIVTQAELPKQTYLESDINVEDQNQQDDAMQALSCNFDDDDDFSAPNINIDDIDFEDEGPSMLTSSNLLSPVSPPNLEKDDAGEENGKRAASLDFEAKKSEGFFVTSEETKGDLETEADKDDNSASTGKALQISSQVEECFRMDSTVEDTDTIRDKNVALEEESPGLKRREETTSVWQDNLGLGTSQQTAENIAEPPDVASKDTGEETPGLGKSKENQAVQLTEETPGVLPTNVGRTRRRLADTPGKVTTDNAPKYMEQCQSILASLQGALDKEPSLKDISRVQAWKKEAAELGKKMSLPETIIAVVGDTGAGKSSLMNALLDEASVLPTSGMRACTAVVVEVSNNDRNKNYEAEVEFLSKKEWDDELRLLLTDLIGEDGKAKRKPDPQSEAGIAWSKIKAVYGRVESYDILSKMPHVRHLLGTIKHISKSRARDFRCEIDKYVDSMDAPPAKGPGSRDRSGGQLWPIVKRVKVQIPNCDACSSGAILVDLPGVRDSNAARDNIAKQYFKNCNAIWIVASINRAVDDKTAKELLGEGFRRQLLMDGQYGSIAFICTKTDDLRCSEIIRALHLGEEVEPVENEIDAIEAEKRSLAEEVDSLKDDEEEKEDELEAVQKEVIDLKEEVFELEQTVEPVDLTSDEDVVIEDDDREKLKSLKATLEERLTAEQDTKAKLKDTRTQIADKEKEIARLERQVSRKQRQMSVVCAKARNQYSQTQIRADFKAGLREMKRKAGLVAEDADSDEEEEAGDQEEEDIARGLRVFTVSSTEYLKLTNKLTRDGPAQVFSSVHDTQIPTLRNFVHEITNVRRSTGTEKLMRSLGNFVSDVASYLLDEGTKNHGTRMSAKSIFEHHLNKLKTSLQPVLGTLQTDVDRSISDCIHPKLKEGVQVAASMCQAVAKKWGAPTCKENRQAGGLHWSTYKATVRRSGVYKSPTYGPIDMNEDLSSPMYNTISISWQKVFDNGALFFTLDNCKHSILSTLKEFLLKLQAELQALGMDADRVNRVGHQQLNSTKMRLDNAVAEMKEYITGQQREINRVMTPVVQNRMVPAYETCTNERGPGSFSRMRNHMDVHVSYEKDVMFDQASQVLLKQLADLECDIMARMQVLCDQLCADLAVLYEPFWEAPVHCTILKKHLMDDVLTIHGTVKALFEEANLKDLPPLPEPAPQPSTVNQPTGSTLWQIKQELGEMHHYRAATPPSGLYGTRPFLASAASSGPSTSTSGPARFGVRMLVPHYPPGKLLNRSFSQPHVKAEQNPHTGGHGVSTPVLNPTAVSQFRKRTLDVMSAPSTSQATTTPVTKKVKAEPGFPYGPHTCAQSSTAVPSGINRSMTTPVPGVMYNSSSQGVMPSVGSRGVHQIATMVGQSGQIFSFPIVQSMAQAHQNSANQSNRQTGNSTFFHRAAQPSAKPGKASVSTYSTGSQGLSSAKAKGVSSKGLVQNSTSVQKKVMGKPTPGKQNKRKSAHVVPPPVPAVKQRVWTPVRVKQEPRSPLVENQGRKKRKLQVDEIIDLTLDD